VLVIFVDDERQDLEGNDANQHSA